MPSFEYNGTRWHSLVGDQKPPAANDECQWCNLDHTCSGPGVSEHLVSRPCGNNPDDITITASATIFTQWPFTPDVMLGVESSNVISLSFHCFLTDLQPRRHSRFGLFTIPLIADHSGSCKRLRVFPIP